MASGRASPTASMGVKYDALACDYDGTLACGGHVGDEPLAALRQLRASRRRLILVTGRQLPELLRVFPEINLCDRVVAENGGVLYRPGTEELQLLAEPPSPRFVEALRSRGVQPVIEGSTVIATVQPHELTVRELIRELGLELDVALNRESVMVLPRRIDKGTGFASALGELGVALERTVGIGDAENDEAFLSLCGFSAAVADALPAIRARVDLVTTGACGAGVAELVTRLLADDL